MLVRVIQPLDAVAIERWVHASSRQTHVRGAIHARDVSIEADGSTIFVHGQRVTLTPREWAILRLLVYKRDGVVSRNELERNVCGSTRSRTLDVHIARLRAKLGPTGSRIQTVVKVGYRYVECTDA